MKNFLSNLTLQIVAIALLSTAALACSCPTVMSPGEEIKWKLKEGSAVFSGEVLSVDAAGRRKQVTFRVIEFWKGNLDSKVTVSTEDHPGACGYEFEIGKTYLVFAELWENRHHTGACSGNRELQKAEAELKVLGKGKTVYARRKRQ